MTTNTKKTNLKQIFSEIGEEFLRDEMNICMKDLTNKIMSDAAHQQDFFRNIVDLMISIKIPYQYQNQESSNNQKNQDFINTKLMELAEESNIKEGTIEYLIFDGIRHAFTMFKAYGLFDLYKHREAESWYPKIIIRKNLGLRDDINNLNDKVIIYRGTSRDEYNSKKFGQSWSLNKQIASQFAFTYYKGQQNYKNSERVLLQTQINKEIIYYFSRDDNEEELVIDERRILIESVKILEEKLLTDD